MQCANAEAYQVTLVLFGQLPVKFSEASTQCEMLVSALVNISYYYYSQSCLGAIFLISVDLMLLQTVWMQGALGYVHKLDSCVNWSLVSRNICYPLHAEGPSILPWLDVRSSWQSVNAYEALAGTHCTLLSQ